MTLTLIDSYVNQINKSDFHEARLAVAAVIAEIDQTVNPSDRLYHFTALQAAIQQLVVQNPGWHIYASSVSKKIVQYRRSER